MRRGVFRKPACLPKLQLAIVKAGAAASIVDASDDGLSDERLMSL
jgi:hypothetical protein